MVAIRPWTQADIDFVTECAQDLRGYTRRDIERYWQYEPEGCFIAELDHEPVGHVFSIRYNRMGWVGLLVVKEKHRQKGIGTMLMQTAIDYLRNVDAETIWLESVPKAFSLYKRLGFMEEFDSLRFIKSIKQGETPKLHGPKLRIDRMKEREIEAIAKFDSKYFGANRLRVLRGLYMYNPQKSFVAKEKQEIIGYIMGRVIPNAYRVGPWICADPRTASDLLVSFINAIEEKETELRIGMPAPNTNGTELMKRFGFQLVSKSIRMFWGEHKHRGDATGIYGLAGPEKG